MADVPDPMVRGSQDATVRLTLSGICGTDLHVVRGTAPDMVEGTILGHEGVGVVQEIGTRVRNLRPGDRVVIPSTIACGTCRYCRCGYTAQCDTANPNGPLAGTAVYGGPAMTGPFDGLQAEYARIPFANTNLVPLPDDVTDAEALVLSDILPTAWFAAELAGIRRGDTVAVFGCGPVGQCAINAAQHRRAGRVIAVDRASSRLEMALDQHAEVVDFDEEDPVEVIRDLTGGIGVDRVIDAVGVDAETPHRGRDSSAAGFVAEREETAEGAHWQAHAAPSQAARWSVRAVAKAGTVGVVGVYPPSLSHWPIGEAMNRNLTVRMGNCHHRTYIPRLLELVRSNTIRPAAMLTQLEPLPDAIEAYQAFDTREHGWIKVALNPEA